MSNYTILIAEDELFSAQYLKNILTKADYEVVGIVTKGSAVITKAGELQPDLILMDIMLADNISGSEAALIIKQNNPKIGIIFITAYAEDEMLEYALESNTYGYLLKPYKELEILANIKIALFKMKKDFRKLSYLENKIIIDSELYYDLDKKRLILNEEEVFLGTKAQLIVDVLCKRIDTTVSSEQISQIVWGENINKTTIRTTINRIRNLVNKDFIASVRGYGYMIQQQDT